MDEIDINDYFLSIATQLSELSEKEDIVPAFTEEGFRAICSIFSSAIFSKCVELANEERISDDDLGVMLESSTKELIKYIKTYTGITI